MKKPLNYGEFQETLTNDDPAMSWPSTLQALWWDAKGDWHRAHDLVDGSNAEHSNWIHAYLHRKEGDEWNARYWYGRAGKPFPEFDLGQELRQLVEHIIAT